MRIPDETCDQLSAKFAVLFPHLDERQRRLLMGTEARLLGHGGIRAVARAAQVRETTVRNGVFELESGEEPLGRVRRPGGGRKRVADLEPGLRPALLALVEPEERGDPMSPLRWTVKSTRTLAAELARAGHRISPDTVGDLLREEGFSLQANAKTLEGSQHPDRDAQFRYLNEQARSYRDAGQPVISVDTKKKEFVGDFKNSGRQWRPAGEPVPVNVHDFADPQLGKAVPYGIYDLTANTGWVNVGTDHDTAAFAVESIRRWWHGQGQAAYPRAARLLITADAGGSNGYRTRSWKLELARLAADRTDDHRVPPTTRHIEVEQDRAPALLAHHHELERPPADQPRSHRAVDRRNHHPHRTAGQSRTRHQHLPDRSPHQRRGDGRPAADPARVPGRLELCTAPPPITRNSGGPGPADAGSGAGPCLALRSCTDRDDPPTTERPHQDPGPG